MENRDSLNVLGVLYLIFKAKVIPSRIRLQKLVCLVKFTQKDRNPFSFEFKSHYYGPYSDTLRETVDRLVGSNLVEEKVIAGSKEPLGEAKSFSYFYSLTEGGVGYLKNHKNKIEKNIPAINNVLEGYGKRKNQFIIQAAKEASRMESVK